ncbi:MAG: GNAT family N-acetyltransferase [Erythrobacter sp.]|uniref:GNAT family N-acetyltransferase n=1 Tax=Erythrobacter sp. TaxID=1042 RepID=UPI0032668A19
MIETRYHDTVNVLQELFKDSSHTIMRAPFDRAEWFTLLEETGLDPFIAAASDAEHSAALVLSQNNGHLSSLRNWYSFTWRQLVPYGEQGAQLLDELAKQLKTTAHRVTLEPVPDEDASATHLSRAFSKAGWRVEVTRCDVNHVLYVQGRSFDEYWASRPGQLRTTLKRKAKKVETQIVSHFDHNLWAAYEAIYESSWKPGEDQPEMLRKFAEIEGAAGRLRLGLAFHDGKPVAAQCWTIENGSAFIHKLAHLESAKNLSAGTTLSAALFRHAIDEDKVDVIDFGTGTQRYKGDWMEDIRPRYRIDCLDLSSPRGWLDLARLTAKRLTLPDVPELARSPKAS